jgi:pantothenate kinase
MSTYEALVERVASLDPARRVVVAIAGAPGSGKSTLADRIAEALNRDRPAVAAVLPMDGYHYDDTLLVAWGRRARKGAPDTFDVAGLAHMLERLRRDDEDEIAVPVFDRDIEIARAGARLISRAVRVLIVEGNYLLLDAAPWSRLHGLYDFTVALDVPEDELRRRLIARWRGYGLSPPEIVAKLEDNDLPNGRFVRDNSLTADFVLSG